MKRFTDAICSTGAHCLACQSAGGERFRGRLIASFDMIGVTVNGNAIVCPFGGTEGKPPPANKLPCDPRRCNRGSGATWHLMQAHLDEMPPDGPGAALHWILSRMGYKPTCGCGCAAFARQMNQWGWWACLLGRRHQIIEWLATKAAEQKIDIDRKGLWGLIRAAARNARQIRDQNPGN